MTLLRKFKGVRGSHKGIRSGQGGSGGVRDYHNESRAVNGGSWAFNEGVKGGQGTGVRMVVEFQINHSLQLWRSKIYSIYLGSH